MRAALRSIRWKRHRKLVLGMITALLVLTLGFGNARVSAITSSERHTTAALVTDDIQGTVDLFDDSVVHTISLTYDQDDYDRLIAAYLEDGEKEYIEASITIDGTAIGSVGIRLKGNSTLRGLSSGTTGAQGGTGSTVSADDPDSLPWLVSFDEYVEGQRYQGYEEIAIRPTTSGETMLNEALAQNLIAAAGEASEEVAYSSFSLNGGEAALRLILEVPSENYVESNFTNDGVLYKALSTGSFTYLGEDPLAYDDAFEQITRKKQQDLEPLIALLRWMDSASDEEFAANLDKYVDVDSLANYIALQELLNNFDDMSGPGQNYYLWYDLETGKFSVLTWDLNLAFGQGMGGGMAGGGMDGTRPTDQGTATTGTGGERPAAPTGERPAMGQGNGGQVPTGNGAGGMGGAGGAGGGMGGNALKERFLASEAFQERYQQAYAAMYEAIYGSGTATAELERLAAVIQASGLIDDATLQSEVASLNTAISTQTSATTASVP